MQKLQILFFLFSLIFISSLSIEEIEDEDCVPDGIYVFYIGLSDAVYQTTTVKVELSSPEGVIPVCSFEEYFIYINCAIYNKLENAEIVVSKVMLNDTSFEIPPHNITEISCEGNENLLQKWSNNEYSSASFRKFRNFFLSVLLLVF